MWMTTLSLLFSLTSNSWADDASRIMKSIEDTAVDCSDANTFIDHSKKRSSKVKQYSMQTQMRRESDAIYCHARFTSTNVSIHKSSGLTDHWDR